MILLMDCSITGTGVSVFQEEDMVLAASPCCGFVWRRASPGSMAWMCNCEFYKIKVGLHNPTHQIRKTHRTQLHGWFMYWTGLERLEVDITWNSE